MRETVLANCIYLRTSLKISHCNQKFVKIVNCLLNFFPNFVNFIFDLSKRQVKDFCHKFLDLYIIDNDELLSWFKM